MIEKISIWEILSLSYKKPVSLNKKIKYAVKIGFIIYIIAEIYINIIFTIWIISYFIKNPRPNHFRDIDQILRYLTRSQDHGIIFGSKLEFWLITYSNFDLTEDHANKKSKSGFDSIFNDKPISCDSKNK